MCKVYVLLSFFSSESLVLHVDIHIKYSNHIPAVLQGPHFSQSVLSILGTAYHTITLIFLACMLSNIVLKNMTFVGFCVCISFYYVPLVL